MIWEFHHELDQDYSAKGTWQGHNRVIQKMHKVTLISNTIGTSNRINFVET